MTLQEFLLESNRTLTAIEFIDETTIINVVINNGELYALDADTSNITDNRMVNHITDFVLDGTTLTVGELTFDTAQLNMMSAGRDII
jgi:hypothetical protein